MRRLALASGLRFTFGTTHLRPACCCCCSILSNLAVAVLTASIVTMQELMPAHAPLRAANVEPLNADAVNLMLVPWSKSAVQLVPQLIAPTLLVTVPAPAPDFVIVSVNRVASSVRGFESADFAPVPAAFFAATRKM